MTYSSGKPKRKRGSQMPSSRRLTIIAALNVFLMAIGIVALIILILIPTVVEIVMPPPAPTVIHIVTATPEPYELCDQEREWVPFTWLDLNLTPDLQEIFSPLDNVEVQVFGTGERCLRHDELLAPDYRTFQTDFHFIVQVEAADLGTEGRLETGEELDTLGGLTRLILSVMGDYANPGATPGEEPGIVHITFTAGNRWRTLRFSLAQVARAPIDDLPASAVTGALGGLSDLAVGN